MIVTALTRAFKLQIWTAGSGVSSSSRFCWPLYIFPSPQWRSMSLFGLKICGWSRIRIMEQHPFRQLYPPWVQKVNTAAHWTSAGQQPWRKTKSIMRLLLLLCLWWLYYLWDMPCLYPQIILTIFQAYHLVSYCITQRYQEVGSKSRQIFGTWPPAQWPWDGPGVSSSSWSWPQSFFISLQRCVVSCVFFLHDLRRFEGFRRNWGTYESTYLGAKLSTLVIVAVIDKNNCLFLSLPSSRLPIVRQVLLLVSMIGFFLAQCILAPFLDPVNNASEWVSRLNYVITASVALAVAFDIPSKDVLNTYVLYVYVPLFAVFPGWYRSSASTE